MDMEMRIKLGLVLFVCQQAVENAKLFYRTDLSNKVNDPNTSQRLIGKLSTK